MPESDALPEEYLAEYPPLTRMLVWQRGYRSAAEALAYLHPLEFRLPPPGSYPSLVAAVNRIDAALVRGEQICVWGDFDVDGQTASALLVGALRKMGGRVQYHIPMRTSESHGLNVAGLEQMAAAGCTLVITCDCGTNDVGQTDRARELGLDIVITDHHLQTSEPPRAVAICNSSHVDRGDPIWGIPGVAMAYLVVRDLYDRRGIPALAQRELDLVALGIIADLAPMSRANRAFLARGLPRLWKSSRPGIAALVNSIGAPADPLDSTKVSFKIAPLLNACGRLADARLGVELLLETDRDAARARAQQLFDLNTRRQQLAEGLERAIDAQIAVAAGNELPLVFAAGDGWHLGLIGPAASRYAALYKRPAVIISRPDGQPVARGSARSYGSRDILATLREHAELLLDWGGHPGAAGFSLRVSDVDALAAALTRSLGERPLGDDQLRVDCEVEWSTAGAGEVSLESVYQQTAALQPFWDGNPAPVLATRGVQLVARRPFGKEGSYADLVFADRRGVERALRWWQHDPAWVSTGSLDIAYTLAADAWHGRATVRPTLVAARPAADRPAPDLQAVGSGR